MTDESNDLVTALVMMRPAGTGSFHSGAPIQASNLASVTPATSDVEQVAARFRDLGFEVGPPVGVSMAITAPIDHFQSVFDTVLDRHDAGWTVRVDATARDTGDAAGAVDVTSVPLDALDAMIARRVERVILEPPRDLHEAPSWH